MIPAMESIEVARWLCKAGRYDKKIATHTDSTAKRWARSNERRYWCVAGGRGLRDSKMYCVPV